MTHTIHDVGIANQIGSYSDAIEAKPNLRWLMTSGTPGLSVGGDLPKDITGQAELAWQHVISLLEKADMTVADYREGHAVSDTSPRHRGLCEGPLALSR
jgi:enamine deaminase RidA (YjgF/YER057c/UK114 family)